MISTRQHPILQYALSSCKGFKPLTYIAVLLLALSACTSAPDQGSANAPGADAATDTAPAADALTVGMILVGPKNDAGWNQAHYEGIEAAVQASPGTKLEYIDKVNPADRPNVTGAQVATDLIARGAKLIIFNSDDFKDDALETAKAHPDVTVIHVSGDYAWADGKNHKNQPNLGNIMGKMEYGKMIGGCAAALNTQTGKIGYLGALINDETRRFSAAAYLGAKYCWETFRQKDPAELTFKTTWIGFWFNIPGKTLDPTKVADDFYNGGFDVVMSGIDTPEAATQAQKAGAAGKPVKFVHYDFKAGCDLAPDYCLGVPFYNWQVPYSTALADAIAQKPPAPFVWSAPVWADINAPDSGVGFLQGKALGDTTADLNTFIKGLGDGSINLYQGPLNYQDGTPYLKAGETATDQQIWYLPQLLEGMEGQSQ
jgi:simple sugar transport system substrate-binding protein